MASFIGIGTTDQGDLKSSSKIGVGSNYGTPNQALVVENKVGIGYNDVNQTAGLAVSGNVGIGSTAPGYPLVVSGASTQRAVIQTLAANGYACITLSEDAALANSASLARYGSTYATTIFRNALDITTANGGNILLRPDSGGNVGVGTTDPGRKLQLGSGDVYVPTSSDVAGVGSFGFSSWELRNSATGEHFDIDGYDRVGALGWRSLLHIENGGCVGIGTTSPIAKFDLFDGDLNVRRPYPVSGDPSPLRMFFMTANIYNPVAGAGMQANFNRILNTDFSSNLAFYTSADNDSYERLRIDGCRSCIT